MRGLSGPAEMSRHVSCGVVKQCCPTLRVFNRNVTNAVPWDNRLGELMELGEDSAWSWEREARY